jgi:hypothetical protein
LPGRLKTGLINSLSALELYFVCFLLPLSPLFGLLLHGNNLDDILIIGVAGYLLIMFGLSRWRVRQLKRRKLQKGRRPEKTLPPEAEEGSHQPRP